MDEAASEKVKAEFAEHTVITDDNHDELLLACARNGVVPLVRAVLQAGANAADTDQAGWTAMVLACENKYEAAAAELIEVQYVVAE